MAGAADRMLSTRWHACRLHERLPETRLRVVAGAGHMVHHTATDQVLQAIGQAWRMSAPPSLASGTAAEPRPADGRPWLTPQWLQ